MKKYKVKFHNGFSKKIEIKDISNRDLYETKLGFGVTGKKVTIVNQQGETVAEVKNEISLIAPKYRIEVKGEQAFSIKQRIGFCIAYDFEGLPWEVMSGSDCNRFIVMGKQQERIFEINAERVGNIMNYELCVLSETEPLIGICIAIAVHDAIRTISK